MCVAWWAYSKGHVATYIQHTYNIKHFHESKGGEPFQLNRALNSNIALGIIQNPCTRSKHMSHHARRTYLAIPISKLCRSAYIHIKQTLCAFHMQSIAGPQARRVAAPPRIAYGRGYCVDCICPCKLTVFTMTAAWIVFESIYAHGRSLMTLHAHHNDVTLKIDDCNHDFLWSFHKTFIGAHAARWRCRIRGCWLKTATSTEGSLVAQFYHTVTISENDFAGHVLPNSTKLKSFSTYQKQLLVEHNTFSVMVRICISATRTSMLGLKSQDAHHEQLPLTYMMFVAVYRCNLLLITLMFR